MLNNFKLIMLKMIFISTIFLISSYSWMSLWIWLEINLIMFIAYLINNNSKMSIESSLIYFLIQTMASILFLFSIIMMMLINNFMYLLMISILIKLGSAPFHYWMPMIIENLSWNNIYFLLTWQKINPLIMLFYNFNFKFLILFIFLSMFLGSISTLNFNSLKKILTFSSINQLGWLLISLNYSKLMMFYMMFYFYIMFIIIKSLNLLNLNFLNQMFNINLKNKFFKLIIFSNFLSLGGLPPFMGFLPKMMLIMNFKNLFIMFLMIMFSLIMLFMYMRIIFSLLMLNSLKLNKLTNNKLYYNQFILFLINNIFIIPLLMIF